MTDPTRSNQLLLDWSMEVTLPPATKLLFMSLCRASHNGVCRVSMEYLTHTTGLSEKSVKQALSKLKHIGLLVTIPVIHSDDYLFQIHVGKGVLTHHQQHDPKTGKLIYKNRWYRENIHELQSSGLGF